MVPTTFSVAPFVTRNTPTSLAMAPATFTTIPQFSDSHLENCSSFPTVLVTALDTPCVMDSPFCSQNCLMALNRPPTVFLMADAAVSNTFLMAPQAFRIRSLRASQSTPVFARMFPIRESLPCMKAMKSSTIRARTRAAAAATSMAAFALVSNFTTAVSPDMILPKFITPNRAAAVMPSMRSILSAPPIFSAKALNRCIPSLSSIRPFVPKLSTFWNVGRKNCPTMVFTSFSIALNCREVLS